MNKDVPSIESKLRDIKRSYFSETLSWYECRVFWPRFWFRFFGVLSIAATLSLPLISTLDWAGKDRAVACMSFIAALSGALVAFFGWQATWQKFVTIQLALEHSEALWELRMVEAAAISGEDGTKKAIAATRDLIDATKSMVSSEASLFFQRLKEIEKPSGEKPNKAPEPTPLPVTPPAEPGVAPGSGVAHL